MSLFKISKFLKLKIHIIVIYYNLLSSVFFLIEIIGDFVSISFFFEDKVSFSSSSFSSYSSFSSSLLFCFFSFIGEVK